MAESWKIKCGECKHRIPSGAGEAEVFDMDRCRISQVSDKKHEYALCLVERLDATTCGRDARNFADR